MPNPVIVDDGGSTRIKHFRIPAGAFGAMDGLLDVQPNAAGNGESDHFMANPQGAFTALVVSSIDPVTGTTTVNSTVTPVPPLNAGDRIEIVSGSITVQVDIGIVNAAGAVGTRISILGSQPVDPQVEAKQHRRRRRYVVTNAPPIDRITFTRGATRTVVFDATATPSVYTFVHLS